MATKTFYVLAQAGSSPNFWGPMQDGGTAPTAASTAYGWQPAKTSVTTPFYRGRLGATALQINTSAQASSYIASTSGPAVGTGTGTSTAGDSFSVGPFTGTFANTAWTFNWNMRGVSSGAIGRLRMRVWRSANADGTSPTEITTSVQVSGIGTLSTTVDTNLSMSWSPGSVTLSSEYLFFQVEWEETTAGGANTATAVFRAGTALITTPDFSTGATVVFTPYRTKHRIRR